VLTSQDNYNKFSGKEIFKPKNKINNIEEKNITK
jgi:hypothetical protein